MADAIGNRQGLLLGVVAKEPVYAPELRERTTIADSMICARCDGTMVLTPDAIGRLRKRCPKCDGVAKVRHHPDQVYVPQTLARLTADALPHVEPGQLRCQRCAKGVTGSDRFCAPCLAARLREKKQRVCACGALFVRRPRSPATECDACKARRKAKKPRLCTGCNRLNSTVLGPRTVSSCSECRPAAAALTKCESCSRTWPRVKHGRSVVSSCSECRVRTPRAYVPREKPVRLRPCGHPYPRKTGRPRRECGTCLALAASPSASEAVA
jgi:hypothetical protein